MSHCCGLELATAKTLYGLLKRQILFSVIARQSADGGWHHGEWSDFMESHYRLHNGAVLLLEAALEERPDDAVRNALANAAAYTSRHTDRTSLGLWFLHDSLEEDLDLLHRSGSRLIPSRVLGKSPATKMILNTHLDAIVALDRYREVTGDSQSRGAHCIRESHDTRPARSSSCRGALPIGVLGRALGASACSGGATAVSRAARCKTCRA